MERIKNLENVKSFHLTVQHDEKNDTLIFDRKLKPGPGMPIYGVLVAKHIIQDKEFIGLAQEIKGELLQTPINFVNTKTSKYNSSLYMDCCGVCKKPFKTNKDKVGFFDTHHINHQKDCKDGFVINKPHIKMNSKANLVPLCKSCHHKAHHDEIEIKGYIETSNGIVLDYSEINNSDNDNDNDNCLVKHDNKKSDIIRVSGTRGMKKYIKIDDKKNRKKKFSKEEIKKVQRLRNKYSQTKAKQILSEKYEINMSVRVISQIWKNNY